MFGLISYQRLGRREYIIGLMVAVIIGLLAWVPSAAHASGCDDSWTNTAGGSWFEGSNWSKGKAPASEEEACITAEGTYTVVMTQTTGTVGVKSLTVGANSGTQTLVIGSSCSVNAVLTTTKGITNGAQGAITLTNGDGCGDGVKLVGPITNAGSITIEPEHGGARELQGNLTNTGTLAINTNTAFNGSNAILTNEGTLNVAEGKTLSVSAKNSFTNGTGGKITTSGSGNVFVEKEATFTEGAGTTSGTQPVIVDDAALNYTGCGKSLIALRGIEHAERHPRRVAVAVDREHVQRERGRRRCSELHQRRHDQTDQWRRLRQQRDTHRLGGTLTNSGTISTEPAHGGGRTTAGQHRRTPARSRSTPTPPINGTEGLLTNEGALNIAESKAADRYPNKAPSTNGSAATSPLGQVVRA